MITKDTVINIAVTALCAITLTVGGFLISLGDRITALEHQIVIDTQFLELMNKMDQRLTIQETLLRQFISSRTAPLVDSVSQENL